MGKNLSSCLLLVFFFIFNSHQLSAVIFKNHVYSLIHTDLNEDKLMEELSYYSSEGLHELRKELENRKKYVQQQIDGKSFHRAIGVGLSASVGALMYLFYKAAQDMAKDYEASLKNVSATARWLSNDKMQKNVSSFKYKTNIAIGIFGVFLLSKVLPKTFYDFEPEKQLVNKIQHLIDLVDSYSTQQGMR